MSNEEYVKLIRNLSPAQRQILARSIAKVVIRHEEKKHLLKTLRSIE